MLHVGTAVKVVAIIGIAESKLTREDFKIIFGSTSDALWHVFSTYPNIPRLFDHLTDLGQRQLMTYLWNKYHKDWRHNDHQVR